MATTTTFLQKKDNAQSTIDGTLAAGASSVSTAAGEGSKFPSSGNFYVTVWDNTTYPNAPTSDPNMEIMLISARSTDDLTIDTRGVGDTSDVEHADGSAIALLIMTEHLTEHETAINNLETQMTSQLPGLINGKITVSVASNNLTVAIKTLGGDDPSASDPVYVRIAGTVRSITAALSVTTNAATNWFDAGGTEVAAKACQYFVYLMWNTTDSAVDIGFARIPYGETYADFSSTSTNFRYLPYAGSAPASTDDVVNIGRFTATLSAGEGYTWSISGSGSVINHPIFHTDWLSWVPSYDTGYSGTPTTTLAKYQISNRKAHIILSCTGTSNNAFLTITQPVPGSSTAENMYFAARVTDSGTVQDNPGRLRLQNSVKTISITKTYSGTGWTGSGTKAVDCAWWCDL